MEVLGQTVTILTMRGSLELRIVTRQEQFLRRDAVSTKMFLFKGATVGHTMRQMLEHLEELGLNHDGPLADISKCLSTWMGDGVDARHIANMHFKT